MSRFNNLKAAAPAGHRGLFAAGGKFCRAFWLLVIFPTPAPSFRDYAPVAAAAGANFSDTPFMQ